MIRIVSAGPNDLGESPLWCWRTDQIFWTDIRAKKIHFHSPKTGKFGVINAPEFVCALGLHQDGGLIVGMLSSIAHVNLETGKFNILQEVEPVSLGNRGNDGRVGRDGRFWFGTMSNSKRTPDGSLYVYDGVTLTNVRDSIIVPNSLCWSPDGSTMYFSDSWIGEIEIWKRPAEDDEFQPVGMLLDEDQLPGIPDGAVVDSEGCLWNTRYNGGCVARISPSGEVLQTIELPTKQVTSCALGGEDLRTLFVTSATQRMDKSQRLAQPDAGALFAVDVDVPGLVEPEFRHLARPL